MNKKQIYNHKKKKKNKYLIAHKFTTIKKNKNKYLIAHKFTTIKKKKKCI